MATIDTDGYKQYLISMTKGRPFRLLIPTDYNPDDLDFVWLWLARVLPKKLAQEFDDPESILTKTDRNKLIADVEAELDRAYKIWQKQNGTLP